MARKKLARFAENQSFSHVIEPSRKEVEGGWPLRGKWHEHFGNHHPLVLELGCGKGEYSVALGQRFPEKNFVGIDIKGARIWYGAREVVEQDLTNVAFLRTQVELLPYCFAPGEVAEIWITFPDPQIKYKRAKHRLTHPRFLELYGQVLKPGGVVHLKTDSEFLHGYTQALLHCLGHSVHEAWHDIDLQVTGRDHILHGIRTHYEEKFRQEGKPITYLKFSLDGEK